MQIKAALAVIQEDPQKSAQLLEKAQDLSATALQDVRNSVSALREDNLGALTLSERIEKLITTSESEGRKFDFTVLGSPRQIPPQTDVTLFRVVQEGINNANKHSQSTQVKIVLSFENTQEITLSVTDNGVGSDIAEGGFGLIGIRERVRLINGKVEIKTAKGEGFQLLVNIPG